MFPLILMLCLFQTSLDRTRVSVEGTSRSGKSERPSPQKQSDQAADAAADHQLSTLKALINETNLQSFGLTSKDQASGLKLGTPLPVYFVSAKDLAHYKPGTDAGTLMRKTSRVLYPVLLNGKGVTVITMEKQNGRWALIEFGGRSIAPALAEAGTVKSKPSNHGPGGKIPERFAVQIPALKELTFIAFAPPRGPGGSEDQKRNVILRSTNTSDQLQKMLGGAGHELLKTNPQFSAEKKGTQSANDVFKSLSTAAAKVSNSAVPQ